jgi:phage repressor protein C with HTH and peptisase S24 domain
MEPTLRDGDWLVVDQAAYRKAAPRVGDLVVARDPRAAERLLIKRVAASRADGLLLAGDHAAHAPESEWIGPVALGAIVGRPRLRYWPPRRSGRLK